MSPSSSLTADERLLLLRLARQALRLATVLDPEPVHSHSVVDKLLSSPDAVLRAFPQDPEALPGVVKEPAGVFVSLHKEAELRGCVGLIEPRVPLYRGVIDATAGAALRDPR